MYFLFELFQGVNVWVEPILLFKWHQEKSNRVESGEPEGHSRIDPLLTIHCSRNVWFKYRRTGSVWCGGTSSCGNIKWFSIYSFLEKFVQSNCHVKRRGLSDGQQKSQPQTLNLRRILRTLLVKNCAIWIKPVETVKAILSTI